MSDLRSALAALDPKNPAQWTEDGLPLMEAVGPGFTRKQVTQSFPNFSRKNPNLDALPKAIEQPEPKLDDLKKSVFGMESSEFGGVSALDDEEDEVYAPPSPEQVAEVESRKEETLQTILDKKAQVEAANLELEEATRAHDAIVAKQEAEAPPAHYSQQQTLMHFLHATQKHKPEKSQIDRVMERKDGYGRKRPVFMPQNIIKK